MTHCSLSSAGRALTVLAVLSLTSIAHAGITALVGGREATANLNDLNNILAGDQATLSLDGQVQFEYARKNSTATGALAYFDRHVFCANVQPVAGSMSLEPRYQLPSGGGDVWQFPDFMVGTLEYFYAGANFTMRVNQTTSGSFTRCLTAQPGESAAAWDADRGLFGDGFGDYPGTGFDAGPGVRPPQDWPSVSHQNFKVVAKQFPDHASGREVSLVRVEVQQRADAGVLRSVDLVLVDAFNGSALTGDVNWCLLNPYAGVDYDGSWQPPADLCTSAPLFPGTTQRDGYFVSQGMGFTQVFHPAIHVLVSRAIRSNPEPTAGQPKQAFAVLRLNRVGDFPGVTEDMQDWYLNDSVWYTY